MVLSLGSFTCVCEARIIFTRRCMCVREACFVTRQLSLLPWFYRYAGTCHCTWYYYACTCVTYLCVCRHGTFLWKVGLWHARFIVRHLYTGNLCAALPNYLTSSHWLPGFSKGSCLLENVLYHLAFRYVYARRLHVCTHSACIMHEPPLRFAI